MPSSKVQKKRRFFRKYDQFDSDGDTAAGEAAGDAAVAGAGVISEVLNKMTGFETFETVIIFVRVVKYPCYAMFFSILI